MGWNGPLTHRQAKLWTKWYEDKLSRPTMDQYYMMQIAACIDDAIPSAFNESYTRIDLKQKMLKWVKSAPDKPLTEEELQADLDAAVDTYAGMFGFSKEVRDSLKPGESIQFGVGSLVRAGRGVKADLNLGANHPRKAPPSPL